MNSFRQIYWVLFFIGIAVPAINSAAIAESQAAKNKRDERNEDEKVRQAKKTLEQKISDFNRVAKAYKEATTNLGALQRTLEVAKKKYDEEHERAEDSLEEKTGIPASRKKIHSVSSEITSQSAKIEEEVQKTDAWLKANAQAEVAKEKISKLLGDPASQDVDPAIQDEDLEELEKVVDTPKMLILDAIDASKTIQSLRAKLADLQAKHADLKKRIPDSEIVRQPAVQAAKAKFDEAKNKASDAYELIAKKKKELLSSNQSVASARAKLSQAILADKKDNNRNPKPKGKKND